MSRIPAHLRRTASTVAAVAALLVPVSAVASAAPGPPPPQGSGQNPMSSSSMYAWYADCGIVLDVGSAGGIGADGFTSAWVLKADPAFPPGGKQSNLDCTFSAQIRFSVKGGQPKTVPFNGNLRDVKTQRGFATSDADANPIRPDTATVVLCRPGGGCSRPLPGRP